MWLCGAFVALAVIVALTGGGALAFLPVLGCAAMMGAMVWMMVRR